MGSNHLPIAAVVPFQDETIVRALQGFNAIPCDKGFGDSARIAKDTQGMIQSRDFDALPAEGIMYWVLFETNGTKCVCVRVRHDQITPVPVS